MPVPVDVEKRKSGQSPNKRREAFKRKRKENEKNEAHQLKEELRRTGVTEPIYENLYKRPIPQKPKRTKMPYSSHSQETQRLSAIDMKTEALKQKILREHKQKQHKKGKKKSLGSLCKELRQKMASKPKKVRNRSNNKNDS